MSNQNSPLKGFRPLKDSKTPSENPPNTTWKSSNPAPYQPPQQFSSSPNINPPQQKTICPYCSSPIPAGSSICLNCGNPVTQPNSTQLHRLEIFVLIVGHQTQQTLHSVINVGHL